MGLRDKPFGDLAKMLEANRQGKTLQEMQREEAERERRHQEAKQRILRMAKEDSK